MYMQMEEATVFIGDNVCTICLLFHNAGQNYEAMFPSHICNPQYRADWVPVGLPPLIVVWQKKDNYEMRKSMSIEEKKQCYNAYV